MNDQPSHQTDVVGPPPVPAGPKGDTSAAIEFLKKFYGGEVIGLTCLPNSGVGVEHASFYASDTDSVDRMYAWIEARQGVGNIYFTVNPVIRAGRVKPKKEDIRGAKWLHSDIDPRVGEDIDEEKERNLAKLHSYNRPPTIIIDSGGGLQAFWRLDVEHATGEDHEQTLIVEGKNRKIAIDFDGDNCHNIDRIMRVPGTLNIPNAVKLKKGRKLCLSSLVSYNENVYRLEEFPSIGSMMVKSADVIPLREVKKDIQLESIIKLTEELRFIALHGQHPTTPDRWKSRSEMLHYWVIQSLLQGVTFDDLVSILMNPKFSISASVLDKGRKAQEYAQRQIRRAQQRIGTVDKPVIEYDPNKLTQVLDAAEEALMNSGIEVYQNHVSIVRVVDNGTDPAKFSDVKPHWLLEKLLDSAKWVKRAGKDLKPFAPKIDLAHHYMSREGEWALKPLDMITFTPTLRSDLTLISEAGYDAKSRLIYHPGMIQYPTIPDKISKDEAIEALAQLASPFIFFPFVPDKESDDWVPSDREGENPSTSRSVVLSAMILSVIRPALRTAPLHGIDAPLQGSGKSLIADCVAIMATGRAASMITMTYNEEEDRKRFFSTLAEGARIVVLDNVEKVIKGDALCTILTQSVWKDRILGVSKMSEVSTNAVFMATGNNLVFGDDMTRRVVICRLDSRKEKPFEREFSFEPRKWVTEYRHVLVVAVLKIILAYVQAGRPMQGKVRAMGSFEDYSIVREALVWLDQPDPVNHDRVAQEDPQRAMTMEAMHVWWNLYGDQGIRLSILAQLMSNQGVDPELDTLREIMAGNGKISPLKLTKWFKDRDGKIINGRRFKRIQDPEGLVIQLTWEGHASVPSTEVKM